ncbi:DNA polymerase III subunit beta [bacterium]|nr:DNA polymerase III subunit beta [candidate division CSSED10-310 bacterium]
MIFELNKETFLNLIQKSQSIVDKKTTSQILQNVKIEAYSGRLMITATDMEVGFRDFTDAEIEKEGCITVSARKLFEVLKEIGEGVIRFEVQRNNWIHLTCGSAEFKLVGMPDDDFPNLLEVPEEALIELKSEVLDTLAAKSVYAASSDQNKHVYRGVLFKVNADVINMVSTDGHRLARITMDNTIGIPDMEILVPRKGILEMQRMISEGSETMKFGTLQNHIVFRLGNQTTIARLIDAQFPDFEMVIPRNVEHDIRVDRMQFFDICRRVSLFSDLKTHTILLSLDNGIMQVDGSTPEYGEAHDQMSVNYEGDVIRLNFNVTYLLEMLRVFESDDIFMRFNEGGPVIFEPSVKEEYDYMALIMPMII